MDTYELLVTDNSNDWMASLFLWLAIGCLVLGIGVLILCKALRLNERHPSVYIGLCLLSFCLTLALVAGVMKASEPKHSDEQIDTRTVTDALRDGYGVDHITDGTPEAGSLDMDDPSRNTYDAAEMTVGDQTYKDCRATFGPASERDHKTYRDMRVTCQSVGDKEHRPVTLRTTS